MPSHPRSGALERDSTPGTVDIVQGAAGPGVPPRAAARAREVFVLATMMAAVLWTVGIINKSNLLGPAPLSDFVQFYTLAQIGRSANYQALESNDAFFAEQLRVLPESAATPFPPVYPPQIMLLVTPLARLGYWPAFLTLTLTTMLGFGAIVWQMARECPHLRPWPWQVGAVAVASPTLWSLVWQGQISVLALLSLYLSWRALRANWPWLGGAALGMLAYKAPLLVPALALCVFGREWRMFGGALVVAIAQYAVAIPWVGVSVVQQYGLHLLQLAAAPDQLAGNPLLMHSLRTLWSGLLPAGAATVAYASSALAVLIAAAAAWPRLDNPLHKLAVIGATIVLTSPHLYAYDLVLLVPLTLASADLVVANRAAGSLRPLTYIGYFVPLWSIPAAQLGLQASTIALAAWLWVFTGWWQLAGLEGQASLR